MKLSHYLPSALALVAFAGLAQAQVTLFNNGSLASAPGGGTGAIAGADLSVIDAGGTAFGLNVNSGANVLAADNFSVPCGLQWSVSAVKVYAYQTNATTPTLTGGFLQIWDGQPGTAGATVIAGDTVTNVMTAVNWATPATYRVQAGVTNSAARRIQEATLTLASPITLGSPTATKTYWVTYGLTGSSPSGPFTPPLPTRPSDNGLQSGDLGATWAVANQGSAAAPLGVDFAFKVVGTQTGTACPAPVAPTITLAGGNFGTGTATIAAGEVRFFKITLATPIGAGSRLDIDTTGSVLTAPSFGPGLVNDTILAFYREDGTLISSDDDDGAGLLSQLTFGTPLEYSTTTAANFDGRDGATLPAGNYYIGVCGIGNPTGINAGFALTTNSDATGSVTVRARRVDGITAISGATLPGLQTFPALTAGSTTNATVNVAAGVTKWVKFTVPAAIDATAALDIFSEGSNLTPANDISFGLYNSTGGLVATDFVNGSGSLALLSFGGGFRNRIGTSWNFYGQNGATLAAGDYYLAIVGGDTSNFGTSSFSAVNGAAPNSGPVNLSIRYKTDVTADVGTVPSVSAANDFGTLVGGTTATKTVTVTPESVNFFKFTIDANAPLNGLLVIDTEGSALTPANDTAIRLFDSSGNSTTFGGLDADAGSGFLSQLTYGDGSAILTNAVLGQQGNSRDGVFPSPGTYYLAVRTGNGGGSGANNWNMNANGLNSGSLSVNIRYVADSFTATTEAPTPFQTLSSIAGTQTVSTTVNPEDVIWVKISLPAGVTTSDWLDIDTVGSPADLDSYLGIYDSFGNLIAFNDDGGPALLSQLSFGSSDNTNRPTFAGALDRIGQNGTLGAGDYYVATTVWSAAIAFNTANFDVRTDHALTVPGYTLNFRSSFTPSAPACLADINADGTVDGTDFVLFINSFAIGDVTIDAVADVNHDSVIDGSDFVAFINAFALGC